jgi:Major Facilitator Superfamily
MTIAQADVVDSLESITSFPRKALAASAIGYAMDGFDLLILGFMLQAISTDLHLTPPQAGSLVTWTLIGAVAGGILFGVLSDYYGRVRVLTWTILLFAAFTGLCAFAQSYWDLLIYRTIAGLGLGGEFGIGMTLVAEAWPATKTRAARAILIRQLKIATATEWEKNNGWPRRHGPLIRSRWQHWQTADDSSRRPTGFRCSVSRRRRRTARDHRLAIDI